MEENKQELLPCPFCAASDPLLFRRDKTGISNLLAFVQCFNIDCGGSMNGHFTDESAIKAWNTRCIMKKTILLTGFIILFLLSAFASCNAQGGKSLNNINLKS
jgi:hypothetical protein